MINKNGGMLIDGFDTFDAQYENHFPNDLRDYDYLRDIFLYYKIKTIDFHQ
jgi:GTP cyclohydrolase II